MNEKKKKKLPFPSFFFFCSNLFHHSSLPPSSSSSPSSSFYLYVEIKVWLSVLIKSILTFQSSSIFFFSGLISSIASINSRRNTLFRICITFAFFVFFFKLHCCLSACNERRCDMLCNQFVDWAKKKKTNKRKRKWLFQKINTYAMHDDGYVIVFHMQFYVVVVECFRRKFFPS